MHEHEKTQDKAVAQSIEGTKEKRRDGCRKYGKEQKIILKTRKVIEDTDQEIITRLRDHVAMLINFVTIDNICSVIITHFAP